MIHNNVSKSKKPKARLEAVGEIIRKNGERVPIKLYGDTEMSKKELEEHLTGKSSDKNTETPTQ